MVGDCPDFAQSAEQNGTVPLSQTILLDAFSLLNFIGLSCEGKVDHVEPRKDARQDGPQDRPVALPRADDGDDRAQPNAGLRHNRR